MGRGDREDDNARRKITLHSFRRFVKTTISDLGYQDFSEWFIGHAGSTYWRKKESEKAEIFRKIEPHLTFLNINQLERHGADMQTKIEELETLYHASKEDGKSKDDTISLFADKLYEVTARLEDLERKQK